jgi:hypothetical protein
MTSAAQWSRTNARYCDLAGLFGLCGFSKLADFQQAHRQWVEIALRDELSVRDTRWSEAVAVGSLAFVGKVKSELGIKALHRKLEHVDRTCALRESGEAYRDQFDSKNEALTPENTLPREGITELAGT